MGYLNLLRIIRIIVSLSKASFVAQLVKNPPAMWETWVLSLGWEDALGQGKATHSSIPAWRTSWTVVHVVAKSQTRLSAFHFTSHWVFGLGLALLLLFPSEESTSEGKAKKQNTILLPKEKILDIEEGKKIFF